MAVYKLKKPITFDGKTYSEISLNVDELSYKDLARAEKQARQMLGKRERLQMPKEFDTKYTSCLIAIAANEPVDLIFTLKAADFTAINMAMTDFLLNGEWEEDTEETEEITTTLTEKKSKTATA